MKAIRDQKRLLFVYFTFYYGVLLFFWVDGRLLFQYQPLFFNYNRDLTELALLATGLPKYMIAHPWTFGFADALAFLLPIPLIGAVLWQSRRRWIAGLLFVSFWAVYLLLADLFWQVHHEPFVLYLLIPIAFCLNREDRFYQWLAGCRYYFCYLFFTAAAWKIARGALFNPAEMSRILLLHHSELLSVNNSAFYTFLIDHPALSWWIYAAGLTLEACFIIGFFTRRYDRLLLLLAVAFVAADLLIMRIPYWTVLMGGITLLLRPRPSVRKILLYETTHHENLPALLDSSEAHFTEVTVFLQQLSYENLSGHNDIALRWPRTRFVVQADKESNRRHIQKLFRFIRRERYSHLHLATLDNNLLLFTIRLCLATDLHVSLTVHEVNEYFACPLNSLRDWTETLSKQLLHHRIRHYTFFLPSMVDRFRQKLPGTVAVFIPSRFYQPREAATASAPFTIVIPGSIEANRRDYAFVAQFLASRLPFAQPIRLTLLGNASSPYAQDIIARLQPLTGASFELRYFTGYVSEEVYEAQIASADLLWSPLNVYKTSHRSNPEIYGQTTASGLTADLLLAPVPALVPAEFNIPKSFQAAMLAYHNEDELSTLLQELIDNEPRRIQLREAIAKGLLYFSRKNFEAAFRQLTGLDEA